MKHRILFAVILAGITVNPMFLFSWAALNRHRELTAFSIVWALLSLALFFVIGASRGGAREHPDYRD